jgi:hypothetical protein
MVFLNGDETSTNGDFACNSIYNTKETEKRFHFDLKIFLSISMRPKSLIFTTCFVFPGQEGNIPSVMSKLPIKIAQLLGTLDGIIDRDMDVVMKVVKGN